jgi:hypothetical protein
VLDRLKATWKRLRELAPGERFQTLHREHGDKSPAAKAALFAFAFAAFAAGLVLVFIPGPAILFFAVAGALLAAQSRWVARRLDAGEVWGRKLVRSFRRRARSQPR